MSSPLRISGRVIAAGRSLAGISQASFADAAGLDVDILCRIEAGGSAWVTTTAELEALQRGLDHFGIIVVEEDGMGAGVRLNFTRSDVRQIARLEGEGGIVGSDDAP